MSYRSWELDGLFVVEWGADKPDLSDIASYAEAISAARKRQGKRLVGMFIMPPNAGSPDDTFRKTQARRLPLIMEDLECAICIIEGSGFFASMKRSALVAILMLSPQRHAVHVRSSLDDALVRDPPRTFRFNAMQVLVQLRQRAAA